MRIGEKEKTHAVMDIDTRNVILELKKRNLHKPALHLVASKVNKDILFSGNAFFYIDPKGVHHVLSGLIPTLKRNFWPVTNINKIMKKPRKDKQNKSSKSAKSPMRGKGRFFGSIQGTRVHQELEDFIMLDDKNFKKKHGALHPWTKRILQYVVIQMKWLPLKCEHKVYDIERRIGTAIDMVCVNPINGHLVFLEFKTGYKTSFENNDGYMSKCLSFMPNSPLNWANIQLTAAVIMLLRQNTGIKLAQTSSFVIRIDEDDLFAYHVDNRFIASMNPRLIEDCAPAITATTTTTATVQRT